ncbi:MAG: DUF1249 domain-containing protein [Spongiibacteraceae bacterium]|jgi:uncharacterized protein YqiB (DUF1249 family)|nr:DUF1249 domain-containing protein [Spongiibacteraceae bacterium]
MAECELNYARLARLLPRHGGDRRDLGVGSDGLVTLEVTERSPYTTTVRICQRHGSTALPAPRLTVRVYHDARLAEVIEFCDRRRVWPRYDYPNPAMHQPDEKAQWNRFLGDWLSLCLRQGWAYEPGVPVL